MANRSNDDRSNSLNPNNAAFWHSENNHRNQVGVNDFDEMPMGHTNILVSSCTTQLTADTAPKEILTFKIDKKIDQEELDRIAESKAFFDSLPYKI